MWDTFLALLTCSAIIYPSLQSSSYPSECPSLISLSSGASGRLSSGDPSSLTYSSFLTINGVQPLNSSSSRTAITCTPLECYNHCNDNLRCTAYYYNHASHRCILVDHEPLSVTQRRFLGSDHKSRHWRFHEKICLPIGKYLYSSDMKSAQITSTNVKLI